MTSFDTVAIIFNPNSTGDAPHNAAELKEALQTSLTEVSVTLLPTERAGHAIELAYDFARGHSRPLIISASGDGGYNEVINGALRAQQEGPEPICAVLPSGNANDHARTMHGRPLIELIQSGSITKLDVLELTATGANPEIYRFAHSYIGLGLTPKVGADLNKHKLNRFVEAWLVACSLLRFRPTAIQVDGGTLRLDSLVCATIPQMAKYLNVSAEADPQDGMFEISTVEHRHKPALFMSLIKGMFFQLGTVKKAQSFTFTVPRPTLLQCDGEIIRLQSGMTAAIHIRAGLLRTIAEPPAEA